MEGTAEIDENEINLAQMWSLFCVWGSETSLQSFKFPCNLEIKEISQRVCVPCQRLSLPHVALSNRAAHVNMYACDLYVTEPYQEACLKCAFPKYQYNLRSCFLLQVAYQIGHYELAKKVFSPVWDYFIASPSQDEQSCVCLSNIMMTTQTRYLDIILIC